MLSPGISQIDNQDTTIPLETFLDCLSITFVYERFLVEMRHDAFDSKSKQCMYMHPEITRPSCLANDEARICFYMPSFVSLVIAVIPLPRVKDSMTSVYELVEAAGWSVPPPDVMHKMVVDAADSKKCISFDILVR